VKLGSQAWESGLGKLIFLKTEIITEQTTITDR
jgi:hypothetical protein